MSVRTLEVDGRMITALEGQTIFSAAWDSGIHIPRLCHIGELSSPGACRLCFAACSPSSKSEDQPLACVSAVDGSRSKNCVQGVGGFPSRAESISRMPSRNCASA